MAGTKQRIVETTARLFRERGYVGSGLKQISTESGAPFGSLYHFFPGGKTELAAEALRWSGEGYALLVGGVLQNEPDIVRAMEAMFAGAAETLRLSDYADACPIATVALEVASTNEPLREVTAEIFESWIAGLAARFRKEGIAPAAARELAVLALAGLEGGFLFCRAAKDTAPMAAIGKHVTEVVRQAVEALGQVGTS